jgi:hypothetical protein
MTFTRTDLLVDISDRELTAITTKLVEMGDPDPIAATIAEQQARMERYIHRYVVDDNWQKTMLRALVLWKLQFRLGNVSERRQKAFDDALKELIQIRDGKFKDLPLKDPQPEDSGAGQGRSGSRTPYQDRSFTRP